MIDIISSEDGQDMQIYNTQAPRAANILSVQVGALEYEPTMGIDLAFFLDPNFKYQNESFTSYLIEVLANWGVNVASVGETIHDLYQDLSIDVSPDETSTALVAQQGYK